MPEIAIVAALEREIWPLVRHWRPLDREYSGRRFRFFESEQRVAVCGGIGAQAARRAAEAIINLHRPGLVQSVGFAGALDQSLRVGQLFEPRQVIDASDGSRVETSSGSGILVSFSSVASSDQKSRLATAYRAQAVDMEAAAVAKAAEAHGLRFAAVKVISDEVNFAMPPMERFIANDGGFRSPAFALHIAVRPWLWRSVFRLARNSTEASRRLCEYLSRNAGEMRTVVSTKFAP
jgi:adenosylhomocysteine nucleosidase